MAKSSAANLLSVDSLFTTQAERDEAKRETVMDIPLSEISDFPNHPFKVRMDESMTEMAESVKQYGVLVPALVRPKQDGGYEMVAGHRRKKASELAGVETVPCIVRELTDEEAIIIMVDSNLQREQILPSEKAFAYQMKLDAMRRQAGRPSNSTPVGPNFGIRSNQELADQSPDGKTQIQRYIRLTHLVPELLDLVDNAVLKEKDKQQMALRPAVELSYLREEEQQSLFELIEAEDCTPSHAQAIKMRNFSQAGKLNDDVILSIMQEEKGNQLALIPLCLILAAVCIYVHCHKKPAAGRDLLGRVAYGINSVTDKFLRRLHLFGMELHKTLWIQKGVVIAALLVYVVFGLSYTVSIPVMSSAEQAAKQYTAQFAGEITDDTFSRMDAEQTELDEIIAARDQAQADFDAGLIEYPMLDKYNREASTAQTKGEGLSKVRSRAQELRDKGTAEGFVPWLIDETPFESVYGSRAQSNQQQAALVAVLALTLLLAGGMAYERQSGMTYLLKSTARGRGALIFRKLLLAAGMTTLVWAVVYGMEVYTLLSDFDIPAWSAPVKNLSMLSAFPLNCSITGALVLLYVFRWFMLFCGAVIVLLISSRMKRMEVAYIATSAVTLLPSLLYAYMGIGVFRPLSIILPVAAMPLLTAASGATSVCFPWFVALMGIATIIIVWLFVSTNGRKRRRS